MHITNHLIDSFPLTYSPKSCDREKLSIPLEAHHKAQSSEIFVFRQKLKSCKFLYLLANPAETTYLSVRDRELSNAVRLVKFRRRKVAVHTFLGCSQAGLLRRPSRWNYRKPSLFCLRSYPGEILHSNWPNLGLSNDISVLVMRRGKVALHTITPYAN